ncbi:MAG: antibiotic biosynthesis monooxygenase [Asgard group archaeon]|nr:antibiotic biosynthesis monooxygenase [Asgard group archaeon]
MIARVWHGYTTPENADAYESLLKEEIFKSIKAKNISGYRGIDLFRRELTTEVEFITVMWFETIDAIRVFAGEDYEKSVVPPKARKILKRFDEKTQFYEVKSSNRF